MARGSKEGLSATSLGVRPRASFGLPEPARSPRLRFKLFPDMLALYTMKVGGIGLLYVARSVARRVVQPELTCMFLQSSGQKRKLEEQTPTGLFGLKRLQRGALVLPPAGSGSSDS
ncbi:hypothetical protein CRG98_041367 [Punica granatum]|uniref:Uncharacterized protein n=1 Tax=Punica granatum TaxID=22663 RepID=A0A2I0I2P4_PUNGR|nr:hypothetical protein CRG98_041367 [Punica granatum]